MIMPLAVQAIAKSVVAGLLISIAAGIPLAAFTAMMLKVTGRQNSSTRFATWYATLLTIALLPLAAQMRLSGPTSFNRVPVHALITVPSSWTTIALALWGVFALAGLLRVAIGLFRVLRLRRNCALVDASTLDPILQGTLAEMNPGRRTLLCVSDELRVPTALGFFNPRVILPTWVLQELSPAQIRPLLLHELAHVRRWDDWSNLLQKLLQAVFFFHPAVWWVEKRISLEREMACDDAVLAHTANPIAYADCLLSVAEKSFLRRGFSLAQAAVSRMRQTSVRIAEILDSKRRGSIATWNAASLLLTAPLVLSFVVLAHSGSLVAFQDQGPSTSNSKQMIPGQPTPTQIAKVDVSPAHAAVAKSVLRPKITLASAGSAAEGISSGKLVEAKLLQKPHATSLQRKPAERNGQAILTQAVYVVMRTTADGNAKEFWTVRVWRLTVFKTGAMSENTFPAKKL